MKLVSIEIIGFGKWTNKTFQFSSNNQLLFGENESGKSTIYQFIQAILFGFPTKGKRKKEYQPKNTSAYGGSICIHHSLYGDVRIERLKGKNKGQASVYYQGFVGDETVLATLLFPLTKAVFQSVFTFQQEQLAQLEKLTEDHLQTSLLSLGILSSKQLLGAREEYLKQAQALYKGKGVQPPLNQKLQEFKLVQQEISEKEQDEVHFQQLLAQLKAIEEKITSKLSEREKVKEIIHICEKQRMNQSLYEELQAIKPTRFSFLRNQMTTSEQEQLIDAYQQHQFLLDELTRLNQQRMKNTPSSEESRLYQQYLTEEIQLKALLKQRYHLEKITSDNEWSNQSVKKNREEMAILEQKWAWQAHQPPQVFLEENEVVQLQTQREAELLSSQELDKKYAFLEEKILHQEEAINRFEQMNNELFEENDVRKRKKVNPFLLLVALLGMVGSFFFIGFSRYIGMTSSFFLFLLGIAPIFSTSKTISEQEKKQWQEQLSQLDYLNEQKQTMKKEREIQVQQEQIREEELRQRFKVAHFGKLDQIDLFFHHRNDVTRYILLNEANCEFNNQIALNKELLATYEKQLERYTSMFALSGDTIQKKVTQLDEWVDKMTTFLQKQEYDEEIYIQQRLGEVQGKREALLRSVEMLMDKFDIPTMAEIPLIMKKMEEADSQQKRQAELRKIIGNLYEGVSDITSLPSQHDYWVNKMKVTEEDIHQLQKNEQKLLYQKQQMMVDETVDALYQKQALLKNEIESLALNWSGYLLARHVLMDVLTELSDKQLPALLEKATHYFRQLTEQTYIAIQLNEGQLVAVREDQARFLLHDLSTGTRDQLIMAIRFGFLALHGEQSICPVIIDDGWLNYDSKRKKQLVKLFVEFSMNQQVICFSSDREMLSYYQELHQHVIELNEKE